jgi:oxygen-dependent protoporphyrinogen oxidase
MPQYTLGHLDRVSKVRELVSRHPGLILAGNAFDGVGIPDCVRSGNLAAEAVLAALDAPPARAVA